MIGPPVRAKRGASCLSVIGGTPLPLAKNLPSLNSTSSGFFSQILAARSFNWRSASLAASYTAMPVAKVTRLPPVTSVWPIESVSATIGRTSVTGSPSTSAVIIAIEAREPPISGEPVTTLAVPSAWIFTVAEDCMPALNQNPDATPRPRNLPVSFDL